VISNAKKFTIASDSQRENISLFFKNYTQVMKNILKYPWYPMFVFFATKFVNVWTKF